MRRTLSAALLALACCLPHSGLAQTFTDAQVPAPLRPWISWSKYGIDNNTCPFYYSDVSRKICAWQTKLDLDLNAGGGSFTYNVTIYDTPDQKPQWLVLPGNAAAWPQDVQLDGKQAVVLTADGASPAILLNQGHYEITGRFHWESMPESLKIPETVALVQLSVEGHEIATPDIRNGYALIAAGEKPAKAVQENHLEAKLFRKLTDGIPAMLETDIELQVSGKQREEELGKILPANFIPTNVESNLPVRLEQDGTLRARLNPGTWYINIAARAQNAVTSIDLPPQNGILPQQEIWSFQENNRLRLVDVKGVTLIDPSQTDLPPQWSNLPAYLMTRTSHLTLAEKKRGVSEDTPDRLSLSRDIWLDFNGQGYTFRDSINGEIRKSSRLEVENGVTLGDATINGKQQYITTLDGKGNSGLEVREGYINMQAGGRIAPARTDLPATGWKNSFDNVSERLYLPPGWTLFDYSGADKAYPTWIGRWSLLDIFLVMIATVSVYKLFGFRRALLAGTSFVLMQHELPGFIPLILAVLAATAILRHIPQGRFHLLVSWSQALVYLSIICLVLPFAVQHLREAIYPQLHTAPASYNGGYAMQNETAPMSGIAEANKPVVPQETEMLDAAAVAPVAPPPAPMLAAPKQLSISGGVNGQLKTRRHNAFAKMEAGAGLGSSGYGTQPQNYETYAPDTKVQTGFGETTWRNNAVTLTWNGNVDPSTHVSLLLISAKQNLLIAFVRVIATLAFIALLCPLAKLCNLRGTAASTAALMLACGLSFMAPDTARADTAHTSASDTAFPPSELLEEMKKRFTESLNTPPACAPNCATIAHTQITVTNDLLTIFQEVHAQENIALPLPGGTRNWRPSAVMVDDKPAKSLTESNGYLFVNLTRGVYQVKLVGALPHGQDSIGISLPVAPHYTSAEAQGWNVQGIHENGAADNSIQLTRTEKQVTDNAAAPEKSFQRTSITPFFQLERRLVLGTQWQVLTTIRRLTPDDEPAAVEIPLLPGETVTTATLKVKDELAFASFDPSVAQVSWQSVIKPSSAIALTAAKDKPWAELWQLSTSNLWHVKLEGIPRVYLQNANANGLWQWQPWPGETLNIAVTRPVGVEGDTSTIDSTTLDVTPEQRSQESSLAISMRSSLGGQQEVTLPAHAVLLEVRKNYQILPLQLKDGVLTLPLAPGENRFTIRWKEEGNLPVHLKTPEVKLGKSRSVNATINMQMPQERWILFASGPLMGPAVLFWSWLPVIVILALGLGRIPFTPLRTRHWFLLLLGLSQAAISSDILIIAWLLALGGRAYLGDRTDLRSWQFNLIQIGLLVLTCIGIHELFINICSGLLGTPDMRITGNGSYGSSLHWYQDITGAQLPRACVISVSLWVYRVLMLVWSLWLAFALIRWLRWGWGNFTQGGYWRKA
ncbi:MAG TPA: hypothetical protein VFT64_07040 [Rickettsiales bacterium]|nr:hypothetical protein [Rickettsiales bacterium]